MSEKQLIKNFVFELRRKDSVIIGISFPDFCRKEANHST